MSLLPAIGTVTYNGFTFNSTVGSRVQARFMYDEAGRTVTHVVYSFRIKAVVFETAPGAGADAVVADLRVRLSTPGQAFQFVSKGFGNFTINVAGARDVMWGPKPELLSLHSVGSSAAWELEWTLDLAVPECTAATYAFGVMAFNYETSYSIDADGYTTQAHSGYLEIPMTRVGGGRSLPDCVDNYRERIRVPQPFGFKRTRQTFEISKDKRRLDFNIEDTELPLYGQASGCTSATGNFSVSSSPGLALGQFDVTIRASYVVARGQPLSRAYEAFYALYRDRINTTLGRAPIQPFVSKFEAIEGLYESGRSVSFEISYFFSSSVETILADSGIWRPVPGTNAQQWMTSIGGANGVRGNAGLRTTAGEDAIIDLCAGLQPTLPTSGNLANNTSNPSLTGVQTPRGIGGIEVQMNLDVELTPGNAIIPTLRQGGIDNIPPTELRGNTEVRAGTGNIQVLPGNNLTFSAPITVPLGQQPQVSPDQNGLSVQNRTVDRTRLRLWGYAVTTWLPLPCPKLIKYGQFDLIAERTHTYRTQFLGVLGSVPVYGAVWDLTYRVIPKRGQPIKAPQVNPKAGGLTDFISRNADAIIGGLRSQIDQTPLQKRPFEEFAW